MGVSTRTVIALIIFICLSRPSYTSALVAANPAQNSFERDCYIRVDSNGNHFSHLPASLESVLTAATVYTKNYENSKPNSPSSDPTVIAITQTVQPAAVVERTAQASASYTITYPNGTFVQTSAASIARIVNGTGTVAQVPLTLTNATKGVWSAIWISSFSANLTDYHFELNPSDFRDAYGNSGQGQTLVSPAFKLVPANVTISIQAISTLPRRENETIIIPALYHDGTPLQNITRLRAGIIDVNGTSYPLNLTSISGSPTGYFDAAANAHIGTWKIIANFTDAYGNTGKGLFAFQLVETNFNFSVELPQPVQRTTRLNVTVNVAYLDKKPLTSGVVGNLTIGNLTQSLNLAYSAINQTWLGAVYISQNATLGNYNVTIVAADGYGNERNFTELVSIIPAAFVFSVPSHYVQANPLELQDVAVSVSYPNGTALNDRVGVVSTFYTNSTGGLSPALMQYNATDFRWHMMFLAPDQRFKLYAITIVFSFDAKDVYGNYGFASDEYSMTVTTPTRLLIFAAIAGIVIPAALLTWAMVTVTKKRRQRRLVK